DLLITDESVFDSDSAFKYDFWVAGAITVENSTIRDAGYNTGGSQGVRVTSSANLFYNATVEGGYYGIYFLSPLNEVYYSTINNIGDQGIYLAGGSNIIQNNNFTNCAAYSIYLSTIASGNTIQHNNITLSGNGIRLAANNNQILDNWIDATTYGIYASTDTMWAVIDNNTLSGGFVNDAVIFIEATLIDAIISNNTFFDADNGIVAGANNLTIRNNSFDLTQSVIQTYGTDIYIINNTADGLTGDGISIGSGSSNVIVMYNELTNCGDSGIDAAVYCGFMDNALIDDNNFSGAQNGVYITGTPTGPNWAENFTISNNELYGITDTGIYLAQYTRFVNASYNTITSSGVQGVYCHANTNSNTFWHNNFIGNAAQAMDDGGNIWYATYPMGGNYWSDHTSPDTNIDGYVDNPFPTEGVAGTLDQYPFVLEDGWLRLAPTTPGDWNITWTQRYHNQTIDFLGDIRVHTANDVYFDDLDLNCQDIMVDGDSTLEFFSVTGYVENISIKDQGALRSDPSNIYANGDVWVDGQFILDGDTLFMNNPNFDGENNIYVNGTGTFALRGGSTIWNNNTFNYEMLVRSGAHVKLLGSSLQDCGWDATHKGLDIASDTVDMQSMSFVDCYYAAFFNGTTSVDVYNSTISGPSGLAFYLDNNANASSVNTTIGGRTVNYGAALSIFYLKWYLHAHVNNSEGYSITGAEVTIKDGYGTTLSVEYTNTVGWTRDTVCTEYSETQSTKVTYQQPQNVTATFSSYIAYLDIIVNEASGGTRHAYLVLGIPPYMEEGYYLSSVFGAGYDAFWSYMEWNATVPTSTSLKVWTRTGPTSIPSGDWSAWLQVNTSSGSAINSLQWRPFFQYRLNLSTTDTNYTPLVYNVSVHYSDMLFFSATGKDDLGAVGTISYNLTIDPRGHFTLSQPGANYVDNGTYISKVFDSVDRLDHWTDLYWYGSMPTDTLVRTYTRSGITPTPPASWSAWEQVNSPIFSPDDRYIQFKVEMNTSDLAISPV
ncbi:MAG: right-handed parallel beta-helix repeat-containing protein, partial [Thermoplasmata archaeon]|nr:right-handed parallel beta-helix repeat-containing protein [Thermoplasmata archaeon]